MVIDRTSLGEYPCQVSASHRYLFSSYDLSATSKGYVTNRWGGWKFIYFWKLHTIPFLRAKFQLILITLNFDDFGGPPRRLVGVAGGWDKWSISKWWRWIAKTLSLKKNTMSPHLLPWKSGRGIGIKKVRSYPYSPPTESESRLQACLWRFIHCDGWQRSMLNNLCINI